MTAISNDKKLKNIDGADIKTLTTELTEELTETQSNALHDLLRILKNNPDLKVHQDILYEITEKNVNAQWKNKRGITWDIWGDEFLT